MEYSTHFVEGVTTLFAAELKEQLNDEPNTQIAELEAIMREMLQKVGALGLGAQLTAQDNPYPEAEIACPCGGKASYRYRRSAKVVSVFGRVEYRRAYYLCPTCSKGQSPLDRRLGLEPGQVTAGLASLIGIAGIQTSFEEASDLVERFLLVEVSANTIRKESQRFGQLQASREEDWVRESCDPELFRERQRTMENRPKRLYGSVDGAHAPLKKEWREIKTGCWYEVERIPKQLVPTDRREKVGDIGALRAKEINYYCDLANAQAFGELMWATGCRRDADLAEEVVFVADGAAWIWKSVDFYFPDAVQIVDWYHAVAYLGPIAKEAFAGDQQAQEQWLERTRTHLWQGHLDNVISACRQFEGHSRAGPAAHKAVTYYTNNRKRMNYAQFRHDGYMIGSGTVESACKQIVTHRLKRSGARWTEHGARETAKARAAWLSGQWEPLCAMRSQLPLAA